MNYPDPTGGGASAIGVFDFDGILAVNTWPLPDIGEPIPQGIEMLTHYYDAGHAVKIHTARPEQHVPAIARWLQHHNLAHMVYEIGGGKPSAGLYIDDRAFRPPWVGQPALEARSEQLQDDGQRALEADATHWEAID